MHAIASIVFIKALSSTSISVSSEHEPGVIGAHCAPAQYALMDPPDGHTSAPITFE